jgi:hypothetical protein
LSELERELLGKVELGLDAQKFLGSTLGQYLQSKAINQVEDNLILLKTVDAEDAKAIREIQQEIAVAERVFVWLEEAIAQAAGAEHILNEQG